MVNNVDRVDPRELQSLQLYLNDYRQQAEIFTQQLALLEEGGWRHSPRSRRSKGLQQHRTASSFSRSVEGERSSPYP